MTSDSSGRGEHVFKLLVTGPFAAGKTTLIRAVSQTPVVDTDVAASGAEAVGRERTTVAMDFGTFAVDGDVRLLMFGTPGQPRFRFMTDLLKGEVDAVVFVIDAGAGESHQEAGEAMRALLRDLRVPLVVAVNRCDDRAASELLARRLGALARDTVVPCQLIDPSSSRDVVIEALTAVLDVLEQGASEPRDPLQRVLSLAEARP